MEVRLLLAVAALLCLFSCAKDAPMVTYDPYDTPVQTYAQFKAREAIPSAAADPRKRYDSFLNSAAERALVVVCADQYEVLATSLEGYIDDLEAEGVEVRLYTMVNNGRHADLRELIASEWMATGISGAVLVGNLPVPWYETEEIWWGEHAEFPCDYYYMDLDGRWTDTDGDEVLDEHSGSIDPDIWVGRITGRWLTGVVESSVLVEYFSKLHRYRAGTLRLPDRAYSVINQDWVDLFARDVSIAYSDNTVLNRPIESVTAEAYRSAIGAGYSEGYESLFLAAHSSYSIHFFNYGSVLSTSLGVLNPRVTFANLFACSAGRFVEMDSLVSSYIHHSANILSVVGSAKTGGMLYNDLFYTPLARGVRVGEAYRLWLAAADADDEFSESWFYGMALFGDPLLRISRFME
jgi:hypothetical protein